MSPKVISLSQLWGHAWVNRRISWCIPYTKINNFLSIKWKLTVYFHPNSNISHDKWYLPPPPLKKGEKDIKNNNKKPTPKKTSLWKNNTYRYNFVSRMWKSSLTSVIFKFPIQKHKKRFKKKNTLCSQTW